MTVSFLLADFTANTTNWNQSNPCLYLIHRSNFVFGRCFFIIAMSQACSFPIWYQLTTLKEEPFGPKLLVCTARRLIPMRGKTCLWKIQTLVGCSDLNLVGGCLTRLNHRSKITDPQRDQVLAKSESRKAVLEGRPIIHKNSSHLEILKKNKLPCKV